jgi:hypothetical protein
LCRIVAPNLPHQAIDWPKTAGHLEGVDQIALPADRDFDAIGSGLLHDHIEREPMRAVMGECDKAIEIKPSAEDDGGESSHTCALHILDLFDRPAVLARKKKANAHRLSRQSVICLFFEASLLDSVAQT